MAGTGWKATGVILIVLGSVGILSGLVAAAVGGSTASGAAGDADRHDCGLLHNEACSPGASDRFEAGAAIAAAGGGIIILGFLVAIVGIVLVFVGVSRAKKAIVPPLQW